MNLKYISIFIFLSLLIYLLYYYNGIDFNINSYFEYFYNKSDQIPLTYVLSQQEILDLLNQN
jgi:hypothetical protein